MHMLLTWLDNPIKNLLLEVFEVISHNSSNTDLQERVRIFYFSSWGTNCQPAAGDNQADKCVWWHLMTFPCSCPAQGADPTESHTVLHMLSTERTTLRGKLSLSLFYSFMICHNGSCQTDSNSPLLPGFRNVQHGCSASNGFRRLLPWHRWGHGPESLPRALWGEWDQGKSNQHLQCWHTSLEEEEISEGKREQDYFTEQSRYWHVFQDYISQCIYCVQLFLLGFVHMNKNYYELDFILFMRVASYFKNNATAVEEKVTIFQKRLLHQTWPGLVSSKTLYEKLSHVWVLFQLDYAELHRGDPMHRLHCSSTAAVCSLREPFVTPYFGCQSAPTTLGYLWDSSCPCLTSCISIFLGNPCAPQQPLPLDGNQGKNYGLAVQ